MFSVTSAGGRARTRGRVAASARRATGTGGAIKRRKRRIVAGFIGLIGFGVFASDPSFNGADLGMLLSLGVLTFGVMK